jgi:hypothetical protein
MTDEQIFEHIGLSASEFEDFLAKFNRFLDGLSPLQREVFQHNMKTAKEATDELHGDVSAKQLEDLFKKYAPPHGIVFFACKRVKRPPHRGHE